MPLTLSHPAVVLPLRRLGLPLTVLVIASMIPDLPLFLGSGRGYELTHSALGLVTVDLVLAIAATAWWSFVMRDALVDVSPDPVRTRLPRSVRLTPREWVIAPVAAVVGAATHIAWDAFTHPGRWGVERIGWLRDDHWGVVGSEWAQLGSSAAGIAIVLIAAGAHLAAAPVDRLRRDRVLPVQTLAVVVALAAATGIVSALRTASAGPRLMSFHAAVDSLTVLALGLLAVTLLWHAGMRRTDRGLDRA